MKIDSLRQLKELMKLCQSHGVENIEVDGIKMEIRQLPKAVKRSNKPLPVPIMTGVEDARIPTPNLYRSPWKTVEVPTDLIDTPDELTEEQLLNWSSAPAIGQ